MSRWLTVLLCMFLLGCSSTAPSVRTIPVRQESCVYLAHRRSVVREAHAEMKVVLVAVPAGASSTTPLPPPPSPPLRGLPGAGAGDGIPRGLLRLIPAGSTGGAVEAGIPAAEFVVVGGAVIAAVGSGVLVCMTASAAADGAETPIDIADKYYGTHFNDVVGWVQGQYPANHAVGASPKSEPTKDDKEKLGRVYVTYKKRNLSTRRYYLGRTSMVIDLTKNIPFQAAVAVTLRDKTHHIDENVEPQEAGYTLAELDRFDTGHAVDYHQRYNDPAYWRIRGREQQLIDSQGGAWSDTGEPYQTENAVRGVAKDNPRGRQFHDAATHLWTELYPYTGY